MLYRLDFTQTAFSLLSSFHPEIKNLIKSALKELKKDPHLGKELKKELAGFHSYRLKRYRIIYKISDYKDKTILIYYVGHRRDVYELFTEFITGTP